MTDAQLLILYSTLSTGLILGAIFSLVAAGVTIVYGCVWLPNASNGQFFLLAALVAWTFTASLGYHLQVVVFDPLFFLGLVGLLVIHDSIFAKMYAYTVSSACIQSRIV